jgi:hypothetical protein
LWGFFSVQVTYKRCRASGGVDANDLDTLAFMPGQPGVCALSNVPEDPSIWIASMLVVLTLARETLLL